MNQIPPRGSPSTRALRMVLAIFAGLLVILLSVFAFFETRKTYWDSRLRDLCAQDGGVSVFEKITLTSEELKQLGGNPESGLPIPFADDTTKKAYPYFRETRSSLIHQWNPEVGRLEVLVKRRLDGKVLGRSVQYWRRGGDLPTGLFHESSFVCPTPISLSRDILNISGRSK